MLKIPVNLANKSNSRALTPTIYINVYRQSKGSPTSSCSARQNFGQIAKAPANQARDYCCRSVAGYPVFYAMLRKDKIGNKADLRKKTCATWGNWDLKPIYQDQLAWT